MIIGAFSGEKGGGKKKKKGEREKAVFRRGENRFPFVSIERERNVISWGGLSPGEGEKRKDATEHSDEPLKKKKRREGKGSDCR